MKEIVEQKELRSVVKTATETVMDDLLEGGFENDVVTTIYGPAGSGKTNICIVAAVNVAKQGGKVIFVDTEGGFSAERAKQICGSETEKILDRIFFLNPTDFQEQQDSFEKLKDMITSDIKLIVVDTLSMLYRLELGKTEEPYAVNAALGRQIAYLTQIARKKNVPILITNQVYSDFENPNGVKIVGGDLLKYGSKCLIELQAGHNGIRKATLIKHRSIAQSKEVMFKIINEGIVDVE
ncbi:DNA repair and recombination protein RadB [Candidatus Woesearchaeota archaeon]|nr:DNA repair and recombination protein RadB [Candidatus Woesearchaeota archaeon]